MLKKMLRGKIQILSEIENWEESIRIGSKPLLEKKLIEQTYVDKMIEKVKKFGFYVVLTENVAMPHSRPEDGVNETGMSLLKVDNPVKFGDSHINLIFVLAAKDNNSHIDALTNLVELLNDEKKVEEVIKAKSEEEILNLI
ncbi:PTS system IIA component, L-Asc family [Cetobacterium ceti]|uniref:Ascorbate-specific PTS system EIIA component n=1 Tax=Cetobacterium ceti TaxID=180163 RepID=A0A1T4K702_9FUSO|nr:PTS sugar transporter subunit IIA [Cetobacterium ceti]SJZ38196.1 PTS system IIA component, L-Asc family [Cetobacterium ceti]